MKNLIKAFEQEQLKKINAARKPFPKFKVGDTVSVKYKIAEGASTRLQAFQGVVIAKAKGDDHYSATFSLRKISSGIGVERKFITNSPLIDSIEVLKQGVVRRAKLYFLRNLTGKASRIKEKLDFLEVSGVVENIVEDGEEDTKTEVKSSEPKNEDKKAQ